MKPAHALPSGSLGGSSRARLLGGSQTFCEPSNFLQALNHGQFRSDCACTNIALPLEQPFSFPAVQPSHVRGEGHGPSPATLVVLSRSSSAQPQASSPHL